MFQFVLQRGDDSGEAIPVMFQFVLQKGDDSGEAIPVMFQFVLQKGDDSGKTIPIISMGDATVNSVNVGAGFFLSYM